MLFKYLIIDINYITRQQLTKYHQSFQQYQQIFMSLSQYLKHPAFILSTLLILFMIPISLLYEQLHQQYTNYINSYPNHNMEQIDIYFVIGLILFKNNAINQALLYISIVMVIVIVYYSFITCIDGTLFNLPNNNTLINRTIDQNTTSLQQLLTVTLNNSLLQTGILFFLVIINMSHPQQNQLNIFIRFYSLTLLNSLNQYLQFKANKYVKNSEENYQLYENDEQYMKRLYYGKIRLLVGIVFVMFVNLEIVYYCWHYHTASSQNNEGIISFILNNLFTSFTTTNKTSNKSIKTGQQLLPLVTLYLSTIILISSLDAYIKYINHCYQLYVHPLSATHWNNTLHPSIQQPNYQTLDREQMQKLEDDFNYKGIKTCLYVLMWAYATLRSQVFWITSINVGIYTYTQIKYLIKIRQIARLSNLKIRQHEQYGNEQTCTICFWQILSHQNSILELSCKHRFHSYCLKQWVIKTNNNRCPKCKQVIQYPKFNIFSIFHKNNTIGDTYYDKTKQYLDVRKKIRKQLQKKWDNNIKNKNLQQSDKNQEKQQDMRNKEDNKDQQIDEGKQKYDSKGKSKKIRDYLEDSYRFQVVESPKNMDEHTQKIRTKRKKNLTIQVDMVTVANNNYIATNIPNATNTQISQSHRTIGSLPYGIPRQAVYNRTKKDMQLRNQQIFSNMKVIKLFEMKPAKQMLMLPEI